MLGAQRSSLNKVLKGLESEGLIDLGYGRIRLKDEGELMSIASNGDETLSSFLGGQK